MSKAIILFLVVFPLASVNCYLFRTPNEFQEDKNKIEWCVDYKLEWDDFKGVPDTINTNLVVAITASKIKITNNKLENGLPKIEVRSFFIKERSWTIVNDEYTLLHEQLHFDICEVFTRKIRKSFDSLNVNGIKDIKVYQEMYNKLVDKSNDYDKLYDSEVYFNEEKQKQWSLKITKELEELKAYEIECN